MRRGGVAAIALASALAAAGAAVFAGSAPASPRRPSATTTIYPDDPGFRYTEYAHATITHTGAVFDRPGVSNGNWIASPGTRVNFRADATRVSVVVTYTFACGYTGCGRFLVEQDGKLRPQSFGSVSGSTTASIV